MFKACLNNHIDVWLPKGRSMLLVKYLLDVPTPPQGHVLVYLGHLKKPSFRHLLILRPLGWSVSSGIAKPIRLKPTSPEVALHTSAVNC